MKSSKNTTSRERLNKTINHEEPDKVVMDIGSSFTTGISAFLIERLREKLGLEKRLTKVFEPFEFLGLVEDDLMEAMKTDVAGVRSPMTVFGYSNETWKEIEINNQKFLLGSDAAISRDEKGNYLMHPQGDLNAAPSGIMPAGGLYFDSIVREEVLDENNLNAKSDHEYDFSVYSDDDVTSIKKQVDYYYTKTEYGINLGAFVCSLGDSALVAGPSLKIAKGFRRYEDWLAAHLLYPEYVKETLTMHLECALGSLEKLKEALGQMPQVVEISGADFGTQRSEFISPQLYREIYKPLHARVNDWVHSNTNWKTMYHTCGSILNIIDDLIESGVDILNPVQCSAEGMDPKMLKAKYGDRIVFWGGGVDTQRTLPFGSPEQVYKEVTERLNIFAPGGGFVFSAVHDIQANTPIDNFIAMLNAVWDYNAKC